MNVFKENFMFYFKRALTPFRRGLLHAICGAWHRRAPVSHQLTLASGDIVAAVDAWLGNNEK